eukprot:scaffold23142_cov33-Tisochrysis_lutea.AAC.1
MRLLYKAVQPKPFGGRLGPDGCARRPLRLREAQRRADGECKGRHVARRDQEERAYEEDALREEPRRHACSASLKQHRAANLRGRSVMEGDNEALSRERLNYHSPKSLWPP